MSDAFVTKKLLVLLAEFASHDSRVMRHLRFFRDLGFRVSLLSFDEAGTLPLEGVEQIEWKGFAGAKKAARVKSFAKKGPLFYAICQLIILCLHCEALLCPSEVSDEGGAK